MGAMGSIAISLNATLMCAGGTAYGISETGVYASMKPFNDAIAYAPDPVPVCGGLINACLVGQTSDGIIVAFRGTVAKDWKDWLQDCMIEPVAVPGLPGRVHKGFYDAVNSVMDRVIAAVRALKPSADNPVYVTGHSKGGGMAPIAALLLKNAGIDVRQVVTFAAPKSGNVEFKNGYEAVFNNHLRFENYGDLVPLVPASASSGALGRIIERIPNLGPELRDSLAQAAAWNYAPVGTQKFIESPGRKYEVRTNVPEIEQVTDFVFNLAPHIGQPIPTLTEAHVLVCGKGYMTAVCPPSVCGA